MVAVKGKSSSWGDGGGGGRYKKLKVFYYYIIQDEWRIFQVLEIFLQPLTHTHILRPFIRLFHNHINLQWNIVFIIDGKQRRIVLYTRKRI